MTAEAERPAMTAEAAPFAAGTDAGPPALVVSDLDGTFLSPDGTVSATNAAAVGAARRAGVPVLFATGRPVRWLEVIADLPGAHPTVIASNGAVLYNLGTREVLDALTVPPEVAAEVAAAVRSVVPDAVFGFESGERFGYEAGYFAGREIPAEVLARADFAEAPLAELVAAGPYVKVLVRSRALDSDALLAAVTAVTGDRLAATHSSPGVGLVELGAPGVSKASMLARVCASLDIEAADVAAFGDMPNDVDLLSWVGRPYVVANAHPSLLDGGLLPHATVIGANSESAVGTQLLAWFGA